MKRFFVVQESRFEYPMLEVWDVFKDLKNQYPVPVDNGFHFSVDLDKYAPELVSKV